MAGGSQTTNGGAGQGALQGSSSQALVLVGEQGGRTLIFPDTPLTRLNYFDGKFLRAQDMMLEQTYLRRLVAVSNQAGGAGIVYGLTVTRVESGDQIRVDPGLAVDGIGQVLYLPAPAQLGIQDLIDASRRIESAQLKARPFRGSGEFTDCVVETPSQPASSAAGAQLYLLIAGWAQALCGEEAVMGQLCEDACAGTTDRPFRVEGIVVWLRPLGLARLPATTSSQIHYDPRIHLRSLVASEVYAEEPAFPDLISRAGLATDIWCQGALLNSPTEVPLAVVGRLGTTTLFVDAWTVRRERTETPPRRYWAWRMAMRPWDVYLAQILQFQCQLHEILAGPPEAGGASDPCAPSHTAIESANAALSHLQDQYAKVLEKTLADQLGTQLLDVRNRLLDAIKVGATVSATRTLINGGILELPPAGYLPVDNSVQAQTVNDQVLRLLGEGLDLRFCVVRPDYVPHALEEAQHMQRISLLTGLDDPKTKPQVDVLVPDGQIVDVPGVSAGHGFEASIGLLPMGGKAAMHLEGAGRSDHFGADGYSFEVAAAGGAATGASVAAIVGAIRNLATLEPAALDNLPRVTAAEAAAFRTTSGFALNLNALALAATTHFANLRTVLLRAGAVGPIELPVFTPPPGVTTETDVSAAWAAVSSERDVLKLKVGESSQISLRAALAGVAGNVIDSHQLLGTATVMEIAPGPGGERQLILDVKGVHSRGTESGSTTKDVNLRVVLRDFTASANEPRVQVLLSLGRFSYAFTIIWQPGSPIKFQFDIASSFSRLIVRPVLTSQFTENPDVLLEQNAKHILAESALKLVGLALKDQTFFDAEKRALFPPPPGPSGKQLVHATRDWVLFVRRRQLDCGEVVVPALAPGRRYRIYHRLVDGLAELKQVVGAIEKGEAIAGLNLVGLQDLAIFAADLPTLVGRADAIIQDLKKANAGNRIEYCALMPRDPHDGDVLGRARLGNLEAAISSIYPVDLANHTTDVLSTLPASLDVAGTDGAIVLLTMAAATVCTSVFRAPSNLWERAATLLRKGDFSPLADKTDFPHLTEIVFNLDSTEMTSNPDQVKQAWGSNRGPVEAALLLYKKDDPGLGVMDLWQQRVNGVVALLQSTGIQPELVEVTTQLPPDLTNCPTILVLVERVVVTTCHRVFALKAAAEVTVRRLLADGKFDEVLKSQDVRELGIVNFEQTLTNVTNDPAFAATQMKWNRIGGTPARCVVSYTKGSETTVEEPLLRERVAALANDLGGDILAANVEVQPISASMEQQGCPVWTFIEPASGHRMVVTHEPTGVVLGVSSGPVTSGGPVLTHVQPAGAATERPGVATTPTVSSTGVTTPPAGTAPPPAPPPPAPTPPPPAPPPAARPVPPPPPPAPPPQPTPAPARPTPPAQPPSAAPAATTAHSVYAVKALNPQWTMTLLPSLRRGAGSDPMLRNMAGPEGVLAPLGVITFKTGTTRIEGAASLTKLSAVPWARDVKTSQPAMAFYLGGSPPEQPTPLQRQVELIQGDVGSTNVGVTPVPGPKPPPGGSPILTIILMDV